MEPPEKTIKLYRFSKDPLSFDSSPFVNKLDALLTFSLDDIVYAPGASFKAPRGKLPLLEIDGVLVPDSELAYETCVKQGIFECIDEESGLTEKAFGTTQAIRSLVERTLYEMLGYERWIENWYSTRDTFLADMPTLIRPPVAYWFVYRTIYSRMVGSGYAAYADEERAKKRTDAIRALAAYVPKKGYVLGKPEPTRVDATVFGFLICVATFPELTPKLTAEIHKYKHLNEYAKRIATEFWPQRHVAL